MSLKVTAVIAAIFNLLAALLSAAQFIKLLSTPYGKEDVLNLISWPIQVIAMVTISIFLFHLVAKQKQP